MCSAMPCLFQMDRRLDAACVSESGLNLIVSEFGVPASVHWMVASSPGPIGPHNYPSYSENRRQHYDQS